MIYYLSWFFTDSTLQPLIFDFPWNMNDPPCVIELDHLEPQTDREQQYEEEIKRAVESNTLFPPEDEE